MSAVVAENLETDAQIVAEAGAENKPTSLAEIETIGDYLGLFGADLIRRLNEEYVPVHHPGKDEPLEVLKQIKRPLFNAQAHVVTELIKGFQCHRNLFVIGEPGALEANGLQLGRRRQMDRFVRRARESDEDP